MMGPEYFTAAGYLNEGDDVFCVACGDKEGMPVSKQLTVAEVESSFPEGLWCGNCGAQIVAPQVPEDYIDDDEYEYDPRDTQGGRP